MSPNRRKSVAIAADNQILKLQVVQNPPKSSEKMKEKIYEADGVGRIYLRKNFFKPDLPDTEYPTEVLLVCKNTKKVWAESGDHPRRGGGGKKSLLNKSHLTPEEMTELQKRFEASKAMHAKLEAKLAEMQAKGDQTPTS